MLIIIKLRNGAMFVFGFRESVITMLEFRHRISKRIWDKFVTAVRRTYPYRNDEWINREIKDKTGFDPSNPVY